MNIIKLLKGISTQTNTSKLHAILRNAERLVGSNPELKIVIDTAKSKLRVFEKGRASHDARELMRKLYDECMGWDFDIIGNVHNDTIKPSEQTMSRKCKAGEYISYKNGDNFKTELEVRVDFSGEITVRYVLVDMRTRGEPVTMEEVHLPATDSNVNYIMGLYHDAVFMLI